MNEADYNYLLKHPEFDLIALLTRLQELEQCECDECDPGISISEALRAAGVPETEYARERRLKIEAREAEAARDCSALFYVRNHHPSAYARYKGQIYDQILGKVVFTGTNSDTVWQDFATSLGWKYEEEPKP